MLDRIKSAWTGVKNFFRNSATIFYARLQAFVGLALAVAGGIDWSQIAQLNWTTPKQTVWIGIGIVVNGIITEMTRRRTLSA